MLALRSQPTPAADVFALGALLRTLVTGHAPSQPGRSQSGLDAVEPIRAICRRCLAETPEQRFPSVSALIDALNEWQSDPSR